MNKIKPWILAARPKTLFAAVSPIIIGLSISFYIYQSINWEIALLTIISALLIQIGSNYANDAYDYLKGSDNKKIRKGPLRMAEDGQLSPNAILNMMYFIFLISVGIGFYLALVGGWPIVVIGLLGILFAIIYTGGPFPLGYNGLGDIAVFIFFGVIATMGTTYLQSESVISDINMFDYSHEIILSAIAIGCLNTAILVVNNIRDYESDKIANKKTLVVFFGEKFACFEYSILLAVSFICFILIGILINNYIIISTMAFSFLVGIFLIIKIFNYRKVNLNNLLEKTAQFTFLNALLFSVSVWIAVLSDSSI